MKRFIYTMLFVLAGLAGTAQTQPDLPSGAVPYGNQTFKDLSGNVWTGRGPYINLGSWHKVDSLLQLKADVADLADFYDKSQIDAFLSLKADVSTLANFYTKAEADGLLDDKLDVSEKGAAGGLATLDVNSKIPLVQIPDALVGSVNYQGNYNAATNTPTLPSSPGPETKGHYYVVSTGGTRFGETFVSGDWIISNGVAWQKVDNNNAVTSVNGKVGAVNLVIADIPSLQSTLDGKADAGDLNGVLREGDNISELVNDAGYITESDIPAPPVTEVNGQTGVVNLTSSDLGLGNVNNTSDANKPISTATQDALDGKENAFSKGSLVAGTGVTLGGTLANRLVGSGNVTINGQSYSAGAGISISGGEISNTLDYRDFGLGTQISSIVYPYSNPASLGATQFINSGTSGQGLVFPTILHFYRVSQGDGKAYALAFSRDNDVIKAYTGAGNWVGLWHDGNFTPPVAFTRSANGLVPAPGGSGTTRYLREDGSWTVPSGGGGGGTATDLSVQNRTSTTLQIGSSTGTAATIPVATTSLGGLMPAADKAKLDGLYTYSGGDGVNVSGSTISADDQYFQNMFVGTDPEAPNTNMGFITDLSTQLGAGIFRTSGSTIDNPIAGLGVVVNMASSSGVSPQLFFGASGSGYNAAPRYRNRQSQDWSQFWTSQNFNPSDYVSTENFTWNNLSGKPSVFPPAAHTHNASDINSGTLAAARIGNSTIGNAKLANMAANTIKGRASSSGAPQDLTAAQVRSLINVANGATANSSDATLLNRANHIGTQAISTVSGLQSALDGKEASFSKNTAFNRNFGTSSNTVAQGNDSRINNGQTAYGWGDFRDYGLGVSQTRSDGFDNLPAGIGLYYAGADFDGVPANGGLIKWNTGNPNNRQGLVVGATGDNLWYRGNSGTWYQGVSRNWIESQDYAQLGTGSSQVRTNIQLDARYLQSGDLSGYAISGTGSSQVRTNNQLDARYAAISHTHSASDITSGTFNIARIPTGTSSSTVAVGNHTHTFASITSKPTTLSGYGITDAVPTSRQINGKALSSNVTLTAGDVSAVPISGNATITGTKTFTQPVVAPQYQGTSTTASSSIPTNAQSLFKASISTSTSYTLTNMSGNPRHIQVMVTNTSSSAINVNFNANVPVTHNPTVPGNATAIFTFLIENGSAWATKLVY